MDFLLGDFCLSCDRQTNGTAFCSSACRLTQLDGFPLAESSTSTSSLSGYTSSNSSVSQRSSYSPPLAGLYLPPAYDFSLHRTSSANSLTMSLSSRPLSPKISEQAQNDLKDYAGSFDQTRTLRRQVSMQGSEEFKAAVKS